MVFDLYGACPVGAQIKIQYIHRSFPLNGTHCAIEIIQFILKILQRILKVIELVNCTDEKVRREAFAASDEVIWLPNGYIAFEARNGALLFTAHGLKGLFIIYNSFKTISVTLGDQHCRTAAFLRCSTPGNFFSSFI